MEKITSKKQLLENLKNIIALEIRAKENYEEDKESFRDKNIVLTIEEIIDDESVHIDLINELITLLEK